jgi:transposase
MKKFRPYQPDQIRLLPTNLSAWLPDDHLSAFISDVVDQLDLWEFYAKYDGERGGQPPYHPLMMVKLLLYGYCIGKISSRSIEKATWEDVAFRMISANQHPDHDSIAAFRKRHLKALSKLFMQILKMAQKAGLVKLGHVSLDGTKVKANASKHKAMSYERMSKKEQELEQEIAELLKQAEEADKAEDAKYGKGKRGDELPEELRHRESRLKKIQEAKQALEEEARQEAEAQAKEVRKEIEVREKLEAEGIKKKGKLPQIPDVEAAKPAPKAQRNFTDPESRIMRDGASKSFEQAYNAQIAVDSHAQIIVAAEVVQECNDKQQLIPLVNQTKANTGQRPKAFTADAGYFSERNVTDRSASRSELYVAVGREKKDTKTEIVTRGRLSKNISVQDRMRRKLKTAVGESMYKMRKAIVEPVFGQIKEARRFRRFSFRGLESVKDEWQLICLTHNILKLYRSGFAPC